MADSQKAVFIEMSKQDQERRNKQLQDLKAKGKFSGPKQGDKQKNRGAKEESSSSEDDEPTMEKTQESDVRIRATMTK